MVNINKFFDFICRKYLFKKDEGYEGKYIRKIVSDNGDSENILTVSTVTVDTGVNYIGKQEDLEIYINNYEHILVDCLGYINSYDIDGRKYDRYGYSKWLQMYIKYNEPLVDAKENMPQYIASMIISEWKRFNYPVLKLRDISNEFSLGLVIYRDSSSLYSYMSFYDDHVYVFEYNERVKLHNRDKIAFIISLDDENNLVFRVGTPKFGYGNLMTLDDDYGYTIMPRTGSFGRKCKGSLIEIADWEYERFNKINKSEPWYDLLYKIRDEWIQFTRNFSSLYNAFHWQDIRY